MLVLFETPAGYAVFKVTNFSQFEMLKMLKFKLRSKYN